VVGEARQANKKSKTRKKRRDGGAREDSGQQCKYLQKKKIEHEKKTRKAGPMIIPLKKCFIIALIAFPFVFVARATRSATKNE
jgi:beta-lactamase regulating signal transducer with metallopeptidase domain